MFLDGSTGTTLVGDSSSSTTGFEWYNGSAWVAFPAGGATAGVGQVRYTPQADLSTDAAAFWTMRAWDGANLGPVATVRRFIVASTAWTDPSLTAQVTRIRKVHMDELRTEANYLRAFRNLSAVAWTDGTITADNTLIRAVHFTELRTGFEAVDAITGVGLTSWAEAITPSATLIKASHVTELRNAASGL